METSSLSGNKPVSSAIDLICKVITMVNGFFIPDWASSVLEKAIVVSMKVRVSMVLGGVLAPVELARSIYWLKQLRRLRREVTWAGA